MNIRDSIAKYQKKFHELENEMTILVESIEDLLSKALGLDMYFEDREFDVMLFVDTNEEIYLKIRFSNFSVYDVSTSNKELEEKSL